LFCYAAHRTTGLPISCLRFFSVYGPRQRPDLAIAAFAQRMLDGEPILVLGDGSVERDFTFYTDIIDGILAALDRASSFATYNLGRGRPVAMNEVIALLERELGMTAKRETGPAHPADLPRTYACIDKARAELGYDPQVHLEEGLAEYVRWLREQRACES
jgi:UDP-glucuronate 4-epimerase